MSKKDELLIMAIEKNDLEKVRELLISKGADINAKNKDAQTSLYCAVSNGHKEIADLLIANGAHKGFYISHKDDYGPY